MALSSLLRWSFVVSVGLASLAGCSGPAAPTEGEGTTASSTSIEVAPQTPAASQIDAKFSRWLVSPTGKVRGMLLDDGSLVHVRGKDLDTTKLTAGDAVHVDGMAIEKDAHKVYLFAGVTKGSEAIVQKPEHASKMMGKEGFFGWKKPAAGVEAPAGEKAENGDVAEAEKGKHHGKGKHAGKHHKGEHKGEGWKKHHEEEMSKLETLSVEGTVADILPARHGKALLLSDGSLAYVKHDAKLDVKKGDAVKITGKGGTYPAGKALFVQTAVLPSGTVEL